MSRGAHLLLVLLLATGCADRAKAPSAIPATHPTRSAEAAPRLPYGIYIGDVVNVDLSGQVMTYLVTQACAAPRSGVFLLPLRNATFLVHRDPDPARGSTDEYTFANWARTTRTIASWEVHYSADALTVGNGPSAWCDGG